MSFIKYYDIDNYILSLIPFDIKTFINMCCIDKNSELAIKQSCFYEEILTLKYFLLNVNKKSKIDDIENYYRLGLINIIKNLWSNSIIFYTDNCFKIASLYGHYEILKWLRNFCFKFDKKIKIYEFDSIKNNTLEKNYKINIQSSLFFKKIIKFISFIVPKWFIVFILNKQNCYSGKGYIYIATMSPQKNALIKFYLNVEFDSKDFHFNNIEIRFPIVLMDLHNFIETTDNDGLFSININEILHIEYIDKKNNVYKNIEIYPTKTNDFVFGITNPPIIIYDTIFIVSFHTFFFVCKKLCNNSKIITILYSRLGEYILLKNNIETYLIDAESQYYQKKILDEPDKNIYICWGKYDFDDLTNFYGNQNWQEKIKVCYKTGFPLFLYWRCCFDGYLSIFLKLIN